MPNSDQSCPSCEGLDSQFTIDFYGHCLSCERATRVHSDTGPAPKAEEVAQRLAVLDFILGLKGIAA